MIQSIRTPTSQQENRANKAYENLLDTVGNVVSPELQKALQAQYDKDRKEFSQAAQDFTPSHEPSYWAKSSCSKCYGRGIMGKKHIFMPRTAAQSVRGEDGKKTYTNSITTVDVRCSCTARSYKRWLAEFRTFYNALKAQTEAEKGMSDAA